MNTNLSTLNLRQRKTLEHQRRLKRVVNKGNRRLTKILLARCRTYN
jgi:hypothetical protein